MLISTDSSRCFWRYITDHKPGLKTPSPPIFMGTAVVLPGSTLTAPRLITAHEIFPSGSKYISQTLFSDLQSPARFSGKTPLPSTTTSTVFLPELHPVISRINMQGINNKNIFFIMLNCRKYRRSLQDKKFCSFCLKRG